MHINKDTNELTIFSLPISLRISTITFQRDLSLEEWLAVGHLLSLIENARQWWWGDWIVYGEGHYGEDYAQFVDDLGIALHTLQNWAYVSRAIPPSRRRDTLSWSHHAEVASLPPNEQEKWLERAEREKMSRSALRAAIRASRNNHEEWTICPTCGGTGRIINTIGDGDDKRP